MQPVSKPAIEIERHAIVGDLPNGSFFNRNWMFFQLLKEHFRQRGGFDEETALFIVLLDKHGGIEQVLVYQPGAVPLLDGEGHSAAAQSLGLVPDILHRFAADRDLEAPQPSMQTAAELDLAAVSAKRLGLQIK